ncbi:type I restriction-modification system subunit M N-terminal domain-containing protein [Candidatus Amarobacter glycogenicus]|uniref:type I restriction-modification system subunit M N-terminal domain-containing protein n=1 Tax=Candidatus Amarobacter glycogenicus TaxID=3140699 RepID=UPI0031CC9D94
MTDVVQKLWGFCHTLRHDGIDYGDYIEQITYLLFLKMADERERDLTRIEFVETIDGKLESRTMDSSWPALKSLSGSELTDHYVGLIAPDASRVSGDTYAGAQSRF